MKENRRKCLKCEASPSDNSNTVLHRFPKPGISNSLRCELWAKYCFPHGSWQSPEFQTKLYNEHRMLCTKHFKKMWFIDPAGTRLFKSAAPDSECDEVHVEESRAMLNSALTRKLQNLICSEQFCGLCSKCDDGIDIDTDLEVVSEDWNHNLTLGDIYCNVFNECLESLPSKTICDDCTDQLIQSYTFIQNSKLITKLLRSYVEDLDTKTNELVSSLNGANLESNICIFLESNKQKKNENNDMRNKICEDIRYSNITGNKDLKFTTAQKLAQYKTNLTTESCAHKSNVIHSTPTEKTEMTKDQTEKHKKTHVQTEKLKKTYVQTEKLKKTYVQTEKLKKTHVQTEKIKEFETETMQCVMCLKDIETNQDHNCELNCSNCNEPSCVHFAYLMHYRDQKTCLDCDCVFRNKEALLSHINQRHLDYRIYKCDICGQKYHSKTDIQAHISLDHTLDRSIQMNIENCKQNDKNKIRQHVEQQGLVMNSRRIHLENNSLVTCNLCERRFENIISFKYHQKSHLHDVKCPKGNKIMNPTKLRRHMKIHLKPELKEITKQNAKIKCDLCNYITWNSILLECHTNRYHLKIKPYICHICSKDFVGKHLLKKHIKTHTVDQSVICAICGKKLANNTCLKSHLKLHTGEKNYPCNICGERFRSASIMNVHKVKKHSERKAACPLCPSKFYTLVELRRHVIKIHWKKDTKFDPRELEGLENYYHLFHDGRRIRLGEEDVDFYLPC